MKKLNLFVLLVFYTFFAHSQATISGKIIDLTSKQSLPYVTIICKENSKLITGGITDDNGLFSIKKLPLKKLTIEIQFIGYKTIIKEVEFSEEHKNHDFGTILLKESTTKLLTLRKNNLNLRYL